MKKNIFVFLFALICTFFVSSYSQTVLTICLEYDVPSDCKSVFSEDTSLALSIEEIIADGEVLNYFSDVRDIQISSIKYNSSPQKKEKIKMVWTRQNGYYVWNDGRGIIFTQDEEGFYIPKTNSYRFPVNTKSLEIKYKVLLPSKNFTEKDLMKCLPDAENFTCVYSQKIKLN